MEINGGNGGLHGALKNVRRSDCYLIDVDSFYPSIMINNEWFPKCRHKERFAELLKMKRDGFKEAKLMINSVYGLLEEDMRIKICKKGQELMHELIDAIGGELIQVNTDGLIVTRADLKRIDEWCNKNNMVTTKKHIKALVQKDVNNYMYIDDDDNLVIKGALRKRGIVGRAVAMSLLKGTSIDAEIRDGKLMDYCEIKNADIYVEDGVTYICDIIRFVHTTDNTTLMIDHEQYDHCRALMGQVDNYDIDEQHIDYDYYAGIARGVYTEWTGRKAR